MEGGTFALYSLLCRYAKVGLIPSEQVEDQEVSNFQLELPNNRVKMASCLKSKLENSRAAKIFLLFATMLGTSMVIGDGVLTPSISGNFFFFLTLPFWFIYNGKNLCSFEFSVSWMVIWFLCSLSSSLFVLDSISNTRGG